MNLTEIKTELKKMDKGKLVKLIAELCKNNKSAKEFLDFYFQPNETFLLDKYKDIVFKAFYRRNSYRIQLKEARQAISDFKKLGTSSKYLADLMLFYVECGVKYSIDYRELLDDNFYIGVGRMFAESAKLMSKENILDDFKERADKIMLNIADDFFYDVLIDIYLNSFSDFSEDDEKIDEQNEKMNEVKIIPISKY